MSLHAVNILGINITNSPKKDILEDVQKYLNSTSETGAITVKKTIKPYKIVTPNPEQIMVSRDAIHFRDILNQADVALPDGTGLVWAYGFLSRKRKPDENSLLAGTIPGVDFMEDLVRVAVEKRVPIALIGGGENIAVKAFECLRSKYPKLTGVALSAPDFSIGLSGRDDLAFTPKNHASGAVHGHDGGQTIPFSEYLDPSVIKKDLSCTDTDSYVVEVVRILKDNAVGIVFIALGAPKQEYLMEKISVAWERDATGGQNYSSKRFTRSASRVVLMSVGGSLDYISGAVTRPPAVVRHLNVPFFRHAISLEWAFRLLSEPWRIRRQMRLVRFVKAVWAER